MFLKRKNNSAIAACVPAYSPAGKKTHKVIKQLPYSVPFEKFMLDVQRSLLKKVQSTKGWEEYETAFDELTQDDLKRLRKRYAELQYEIHLEIVERQRSVSIEVSQLHPKQQQKLCQLMGDNGLIL